MSDSSQPVALLADSRQLFSDMTDNSLGARLINTKITAIEKLKAAYIGVSNGNDPKMYYVFVQAMKMWGILNTRHIMAQSKISDWHYLEWADLVLLSGGDIRHGLASLRQSGLAEIIGRRYRNGATIIGVSAGAVQLGLGSLHQTPGQPDKFHDGFAMVPYVVDVHDEPQWERLIRLNKAGFLSTKAYGIPAGSALLCYPDHSIVACGGKPYEICPSERNEQLDQALHTHA